MSSSHFNCMGEDSLYIEALEQDGKLANQSASRTRGRRHSHMRRNPQLSSKAIPVLNTNLHYCHDVE